MVSFATVAELGSYLDRDLLAEAARAQLLLDSATDVIKSETGQVIGRVDNDIVVLNGDGEEAVYLPERPVTALLEVKVNDVVVAVDKYQWTREGTLTKTNDRWPTTRQSIAVRYNHGFDPIPAIVKGVCLQAAARAYTNPAGHTSETIGPQTQNYSKVDSRAGASIHLLEEEKRMLDPYRSRIEFA